MMLINYSNCLYLLGLGLRVKKLNMIYLKKFGINLVMHCGDGSGGYAFLVATELRTHFYRVIVWARHLALIVILWSCMTFYTVIVLIIFEM